MHAGERVQEKALWLLLLYVFSSTWACPMQIGLSQECCLFCLFCLKSSLWSSDLPFLLATAILDSFSLFYLPNTWKILQRNRPPNNYKTGGLLLSHLPIKQLPRSSKSTAGPACPTTWDLPRTGLADAFTQMPVSQGYKYLLVMIDTFTGWIEGFPTRLRRLRRW